MSSAAELALKKKYALLQKRKQQQQVQCVGRRVQWWCVVPPGPKACVFHLPLTLIGHPAVVYP